jgi:hypothetical protein
LLISIYYLNKVIRNRQKKNHLFDIELLGRAGLRYTENGKSLVVDTELTYEPAGSYVYVKSIIKWDNGELISSKEKKHIIDNMKTYLESCNLVVQLVE